MIGTGTKKILRKIIRYTLSPFILFDYIKFIRLNNTRFTIHFSDLYPCIKDKTVTTSFDRHNVYQTGWAARKVREINPPFHVDISSSLYFVSILSAFIPVKFYDYRPAELYLDRIESNQGNLTNLPFPDSSIESLSCLHTVEHVGLGRYGDPMDPDGDLKAIKELIRVLRPGGSLLLVTPIGGKAIIEFNAHRIYTYDLICEYFKDLELKEFSLIHEHTRDGSIILNASREDANKEHYGCGCFWFTKT